MSDVEVSGKVVMVSHAGYLVYVVTRSLDHIYQRLNIAGYTEYDETGSHNVE